MIKTNPLDALEPAAIAAIETSPIKAIEPSQPTMPRIYLLVFIFFYFVVPQNLFAQSRTMNAQRLQAGERVDLDGRLDESFWQTAVPANAFLQRDPFEGEASTEDTEVFVVYDANNLYLGVMLHDSDPEGILGFQKQRDASLQSDDRFMWILDTFRDGRTGYFFEINPAGLMGDGILGTTSGVNKSWDGIWEARVDRGTYGWSAEVRIPFRTLNFDPQDTAWGINFQRTIRRKNEETLWNGHLRNQSLFEPIFAGNIDGLSGMSQGIGLEVTPYAISSWSNIPDNEDPTSVTGDAGFDVTYSITPSLRGAVSVNTDFAEVEVDQRRVNLTRFPIQFPEQRDFFLEGSRVFDFAPRNGASPYFSRRIGLVGGQQIPISYGARLAGQQGPFDLGFLHVRTSETDLIPAENFTVARAKRNFGEQSSIGTIFTRRGSEHFEGEAVAPDRYTAGADLEITTSKLFGDRNFNFQAFLVWHNENAFDETSSDWDRTVRGARFRYNNDPWVIQTSYREFGNAYDPAIGFNRRNDFKRIEPQVLYTPRLTNSPVIRELIFRAAYESIWSLDNAILTRGIDVTFFGVEFESGDEIFASVEHASERLENPFNIYEDLVIAPDEYVFTEWGFVASSANWRQLSGYVELVYGDFWTGSRTQYEVGMSYKPMPGISLGPSWEHNEVQLAEGDFITNLYRFNGAWQLNPWIATSFIVQYDDVSELLTLFSRFRWTLTPGNDIYFIFSRNWENQFTGSSLDRFRLRAFETGASLKVNYTHRF